MYHRQNRIFLWILIGTGSISFTSCGRDAALYQESIGASTLSYPEGDTAESGTAEDSPAEDSTTKSDASESGMAKDGTAGAGTKSGAGSDTAEPGADAASSEGLQSEADEKPEQKGTGSGDGEETAPGEVPQLPETASELTGFVPEGWEILDSVELDFNEDGIPDYIGVLQAAMIDKGGYQAYQDDPRILFAAAGDGAGGYRLDFQDINLIRTRGEGGVFGDPYEPLTAEGASFTTHAYGGSAWRWSEDYTYTYRGGAWYLTASETIYGYGSYITSYSRDDWDSGKGIRKERSSEFSDMEKNWENGEDWDSVKYDLEYELPLDEPLTLDTPTFWYPFSNVSSDGYICTGNQDRSPVLPYDIAGHRMRLSGYRRTPTSVTASLVFPPPPSSSVPEADGGSSRSACLVRENYTYS